MRPAVYDNRILHRVTFSASALDVEPLIINVTGSHSFGCANRHSDWDVKAVFALPQRRAFSLWEHDVAPHMAYKDALFDISAWELRRFMRLLACSNPTCIETLQSEHTLLGDALAVRLLELSRRTFSARALAEHHTRIMRSQRGQDAKVEDFTFKQMLVATRSLLVLERVMAAPDKLPPITFQELLISCIGLADAELINEIAVLVATKTNGAQNVSVDELLKLTGRIRPALQSWIDHGKERLVGLPVGRSEPEAWNALYLETMGVT